MKRIQLFTHSFISTYRLEKWNFMIGKQDWPVRDLAKKVSLQSPPFIASVCFVCSGGGGAQTQKSLSWLYIATQCHVMYCCAVQCDSMMNLNCDCKIQSESRSLFCRDLKQRGRSLDLSTTKYWNFYCLFVYSVWGLAVASLIQYTTWSDWSDTVKKKNNSKKAPELLD